MEATKIDKLPDFVTFDKHGEPKLIGSLLAKHVRENLFYKIVRDSGRSDQQIYVYADGVYKPCSAELFKGYIKKFVSVIDEEYVKMSGINEAYKQLTTDLEYIGIEELDSDESIINFRNGILKISDGQLKLLPHSPEYLSTIQIPCDWTDKKVSTPVFDNYLKTLTSGDKEVENLLLEFMGAVISNVKGYRMKKSLFMVGPGDTGKTQLKSLCEKLIGPENYSGCELSDLEERFGTSDLYCKRLIGSADASGMKIKEFKAFKKLTGGDTIRAEFKGLKAFNFTYNGLMWLCMNNLPKFGGDNGPWVYERIMVVSCNNVIPKDKQDKTLLEKMFAERTGIIQKAVKALTKVIENGYRFSEPKSVIEMREKYMNDNNTVITFFRECMCERGEKQPFDDCTTGKIFRAYKAWCRNNYPGFCETERDFRKEISKIIGGEYKEIITRRNGSSYFKNFTLTLEAKRDYCITAA